MRTDFVQPFDVATRIAPGGREAAIPCHAPSLNCRTVWWRVFFNNYRVARKITNNPPPPPSAAQPHLRHCGSCHHM